MAEFFQVEVQGSGDKASTGEANAHPSPPQIDFVHVDEA